MSEASISTVTRNDLKAAQASLPDSLQSVTTAVTIKALMTYTERVSDGMSQRIKRESLALGR